MSLSTFYYVAVKGSLHASDCSVFGLIPDEIQALAKRYESPSSPIVNGVIIKEIMSNSCCSHSHAVCTSVYQTLDELDFERGIWFAAQHDDLERLNKLLRQGVCVNQEDAAGYHALHYAARAGHTRICRRLLDAGAAVNATTRAGCATALHRASTAGKLSVVQLLLAASAKCDLQDSDGKTPLHRAAEQGHSDIVKALLEVSPHLVNVADNRGNLPWQSAGVNVELRAMLQPL